MSEFDWLNSILWIGLTLATYAVALNVYKRFGAHPLLHPLITTVILVGVLLQVCSLPIAQYQDYSFLLHWLLGPATIALAVPLRLHFNVVLQQGYRGVLVILLGGLLAPALSVLLMAWSGPPPELMLSMLTKSITTPLAIETAEVIGGVPSLAAVLVIITGIIGAISASTIFTLFKINHGAARGLALGIVAHAVGTARAMQLSGKTGAYASLALCINGIVTATLLPLFIWMFN